MVTRLARVGNSVSARLPRWVLEELKLAAGDEVRVVLEKRAIVLKPVRRSTGRKRLTLRAMLKGMRPAAKGREVDWGAPADGERL